MTPDVITRLRTLCASIAERTDDGQWDTLTLLAAMSDTLDAYERLDRRHTEICVLAAKRADHVVFQGEALDKALADIGALWPAAKIYLDAIDNDPEHEYLTLPEAFLLTRLREAIERHKPHTEEDDR